MNPSILRKKFLNPSIFWERVKRNLRFWGFQQFSLSIVKAYKYGTHWFKSLTEPLYHVNSQYPPFYCWMCKWKWLKKIDWRKNYECFSDNSCNSIRKKLINMTQLIYMGVVFIRYQYWYWYWYQNITDDQMLEWVFFIVYVKYFQILKIDYEY